MWNPAMRESPPENDLQAKKMVGKLLFLHSLQEGQMGMGQNPGTFWWTPK